MRNLKKAFVVAICISIVFILTMGGCSAGNTNDAETPNGSNGDDSSATATIDPNQKWDLTLSEQISEKQALAQWEKKAFEAIKERTNGQVNITPYYDNTLLDHGNQYSGIAQGMADICFYQMDANAGAQALSPVLSLPIIGERLPAADLQKVYQQFYDDHEILQEENHKSGVHMIMVAANPASVLHGTKKAYEKATDINGEKIIAGARFAPMIESFGTSLQVPVSEFYTSLDKKLAQGQITHFNASKIFGTIELLKTHTFTGPTINSGFANEAYGFLVNLKVWESIPKEYQDIIKEELSDKVYQRNVEGSKEIEAIVKDCVDRGDKMIYLEGDEIKVWEDAAKKSVETWLNECEAAGYDRKECQALYDDLIAKTIVG